MIKKIALLTMLIDHVGYLFFPEQVLFKTIGRIAFPIFAYQISIGLHSTSNHLGSKLCRSAKSIQL